MATKLDVARLLDGESSADVETRHGYSQGASVRNGTATGDSSNGWVSVLVDGSTASVAMRTDVAVKKGERGTVISQGGTCKFIPVESMNRAAKDNSNAIEAAQKTLKEAQDDLADLDEKLYGDGTEENPGALKELEDNLGELDTALDGLDDDLHGKGGLDDKLADLNTDLATLNTDLYGEDGQSGKLGESGELAQRMSGLDTALGELNTDLYGDGTKENPGKLAELDADLDPDNEDGAMGQAVAKARAAQEAAKTAKETADGKNKVYAQSGQPSGTFVQGDLWRKLDSSDNIVGEYVWNGSAWVKHALTADSLLVGSIASAAAFIEALQTNKLTAKEVDAGSIVTKAVISAAVKTDKLDSNEINVNELAANEAFIKTLVAAELFAKQVKATTIISDFLEANQVTANQVSSGAVTTDKLGANAVTAAKVDVDSLVADTAWMKKLAASTALIDSLYASLITAHKITANQLISVNDGSYAELAGAVLSLFDGDKNALSKLAATYADFCSGRFHLEVNGDNVAIKNSKGGAITISAASAAATSSWASPSGTATMAAGGNMSLSSTETVIPFSEFDGMAMSLSNHGVYSSGINGNVVAGFAMFEE